MAIFAKRQPERPRLLVEELEPRILYSADAAALLGLASGPGGAQVREFEAPSRLESSNVSAITSSRQNDVAHEIVFVDSRVPDAYKLADELAQQRGGSRQLDIVILNAMEDGITQINRVLANESGLAAIHIISHGSDGAIEIGNSQLDNDRLSVDAQAVARWGQSLARGGDLLLYGCDVAQSAKGQTFVQNLARLTGADVAASSDRTGSVSIGDNWTLEFATGTIHTQIPQNTFERLNWAGVLATFTVTSTADSVASGTLRWAITQANSNGPASDRIEFNIAGAGVQTISLTSALPTLTGITILDARTQGGYAGTPLIRLDGNSAGGGVSGIAVGAAAGGSEIRGLMITRFSVDGINIAAGANNVTIADNWIGTAGTGTTGVGNADDGIDIAASNASIIGNVITNNADEGINIAGSGVTAHVIQGNIIGLDPDGATNIGIGDVGIAIISGTGNTIGGTTAAARNVISRQTEGIEINTANNMVQGNYIGTDISGTLNRGNRSGDGIQIQGSADNSVVGGTVAGAGNLIAYNTLAGVAIGAGTGHQVLGNTIYANTNLGIDLGTTAGITANDPAPDSDAGPNNLQNFPALTSANSNAAGTTIAGSLTSALNTTYRIEFFASRPSVADASNGEGERYLGSVGVVTDGSGFKAFTTTLANVWINAGDKVTATATNLTTNDTSEFAANVTATSTGIVVVDTTSDTVDGTTSSITNLGNARGADGRISLREAILAANNTPNGASADRIVFNIPLTDPNHVYYRNNAVAGTFSTPVATTLTDSQITDFDTDYLAGTARSWYNISLSGVDLNVTQALIIDGSTQPDYDAAKGAIIELNAAGISSGDPNGLTLTSGASTIRGLVINRAGDDAIEIDVNAGGSTIVGNYLGTDVSGLRTTFGNGYGITIKSDANTIGGTSAADRNVIGGNTTLAGLSFGIGFWQDADNNVVQGNYIGVGADGVTAMGNRQGITFQNTARLNLIGGTAPGAGNIIANHSMNGVDVIAGTGNAVLGNLTYSNSLLGINLGTAGVTANDANDADTGANNLQNFPVLTSAGTDGTKVAVAGSINSTANTTLRIEIFANAAGDSTGYGEGQSFLGATTVITDGSGNGRFMASFARAVPAGQLISATATVMNLAGTSGSTSEFALNVAATSALIVDTTNDELDGTTTSVAALLAGKGADGKISLREAIIATNNTAGTETIFLPAGTYTLTRAGAAEDLASTGDLDITGSLILAGAGSAQTTVNGNSLDRVFEVISGTVAISDLTILGGNPGGGSTEGGGLRVAGGAVTVERAVITGNSAGVGAGIAVPGGTLSLTDSTVSINTASTDAGGLLVKGTQVTLVGVTMANNTTVGSGGGIYTTGGGALVNATNVTLSGNTAGTGGGIRNTQTAIFKNVTITNNSATTGGGIFNAPTGSLTIGNSIVAGNSAPTAPDASIAGSLTTQGYNIIGNTTGSSGWVASDFQNVNPLLDALANNGGPTWTHALQASSPARDAGTVTGAPATDQRGITRDATPDIGAYEYVAGNAAPVITLPGAAMNYTENAAATLVDATATASDTDSANFDTGTLTIDYSANGSVDDRLAIVNQGTGAGQIGVSGANVTYAGVTIGSWTGGSGTTPLVITFNASSSPAAAQALMRNITYANVSDAPSTAARTVRFVLTDGAGGTSAAATKTINVTAVNDAPTLTTMAAPVTTVNEDSQATVTFANLQTQGNEADVDGTVNAFVVKAVSSGTLLVGTSAGTATAWVAGTNDTIDATRQGYWTAALNANGTLNAFTVVARDNGALESATPVQVQVAVNAVNDAPTLDAAKSPALTAQNEDSGAPVGAVGALVSAVVNTGGALNNVTDPDAGALLGIAITAADTSQGSWYYSTDNGTNWNALGAVSGANARLLAADANTRLYFQPNANYNGTLANAITFRAWDQTSGTNGGTSAITNTAQTVLDNFSSPSYSNNNGAQSWSTNWVETDTNGGGATGGFIWVDSGRLRIDAPTGNGIYREANLTGATTASLSFDYDNQIGQSTVLVVQVSADGGGNYSTVATYDSSNAVTGSANIDISAYISADTRVRWLVNTASAAQRNTYFDNIQITYTTPGGGTTAFSAATDTASLTVNPVADTPSVTNATTNEDTQSTTGLVISRNAADGAEVTHFKVTGISNGTLYRNDGVTVIGNGSFITFAQGNAGLRFTPTANFNGSGSFTAQGSTSNLDAGLGGSTVNATITVNPVNDAPVLAAIEGTALAYTENAAATAITGTLTVSDEDSANLAGATVSISANYASGEDVLGFTTQFGITGSWNVGTGVLTLSGTATLADYQVALRSITYFNSSDNPGTFARTVSFVVNDGSSNSSAATRTINVTAVNDAPLIVNSSSSLSYPIGSAAALIDPTLALNDVDNATLSGATIAVSGGYVSGQDVLAFATQNGISGSWNGGTGVMTLSGSATVVQYQAALRSVSFQTSSTTSAPRTVEFIANDGALSSTAAQRTVMVGTEVPSLWLSSKNSATTSAGTGALTYNDGQIARLSNPNLALGPGTSNGLFSHVFDIDSFAADGNAKITGLHYVNATVVVGTTNPVTLLKGDILLSVDANETLGGVAVTKQQVVLFRPTTLGDYSTGTFSILLRKPGDTGNEVYDFALVETAMTVGGTALQAGDFLMVFSGGAYDNDISLFRPTAMLSSPTGGALSVLVDGNGSAGIGLSKQIHGLELVQSDITLGGTSLTQGQLLIAIDGSGTIGSNSLAANEYDVIALTVTATGNGTSSGTASMLLRGADVGLSAGGEDIDAVALVAVYNTAPTLDITKSPTLTAQNEDAGAPSGAVGTLISSLVDFALPAGQVDNVSDPDAAAQLGIAVVGADISNGSWWYSTNGGGSWAALGPVSDANARLLAADASTRLYFQPNANWNGSLAAAIAIRAWDLSGSTASSNGGLLSTASNGGFSPFSSATDTVSITVNALNDAPVLGFSGTIGMTATNEDTTSAATLVSNILISGLRSDVDSGAFSGIAVLTVSANGTFEYSTDGATWTAFGAVSTSNALLLNSTSQVRYVPDGNNGEAAIFTYKAWDRTSDSSSANGAPQYANPGTGGGSSAFSAQTGTVQETVTAANDAPTIASANNLSAINRNPVNNPGTLVAELIAGQVGDPDTGALRGVAVTGVVNTNGSWEYSTNGGGSWTAFGSPSAGVARLLAADASSYVRFVPTANWSGTVSNGLSFQAWDQTSGAAGATANTSPNGGSSAFSTATASASILVNASNTAPTLSGANNLGTINEDPASNPGTLVSALIAGRTSDVDPGPLTGIAVTTVDNSNGNWQYTLNSGGLWTDFGTPSSTAARLLAANASSLVRFVPNANWNGSVNNGITFRAWDQTSGAAGSAVNTTVTNNVRDNFSAVAYSNNDGSVNWSGAWIEDDSLGNSPAGGNIRVIGGSLEIKPNTVQSISRSVDLSSASTASLSFSYTNTLGAGDLIQVQVSNNGGASWTTLAGATFDNATNTGSGIKAIDISSFIASNSAIRIYQSAAGAKVAMTFDNIDISYQSTGGGTTAFSSASASSSITVNAVNDAPVRTAGAIGNLLVAEDAAATSLGLTALVYGPGGGTDEAVQTITYTVTAVPAAALGNITLADGSTIVNAGSGYSLAQLRGMMFRPTANASGGPATFGWRVADSGGTANGGVDTLDESLTIGVTSVNDAPSGTSKTMSTAEDTAIVFTAADFGFSDTSDTPANAMQGVRITTPPTAGALTNNGIAVIAGQTITLADIGSGLLRFTPAPDANDAGYASFSFQVQDNGGTANGGVALDPTPNTITVDVSAVNDAPMITSNGGGASTVINMAENSAAVSIVTVADPDLPAQSLSYSVVGGADAAHFTIHPTSGALSFITAPDFEAPTDSNADNVYNVTVGVSDGAGGTDTQALSVGILDQRVTIDTQNTASGTGASLTLAHTASGSNRLMLVTVSMGNPGSRSVSGISYNGAALTLIGSRADSGNEARIELWALVAPDLGAHNVVVTLSGANPSGTVVGVSTFTGVDQGTPLGAFASAGGDSSGPSVNVASGPDQLVFAGLTVESGTNYNLVTGVGQTEHWDLHLNDTNSGSSTEAGAASVTMSWTFSDSNQWAVAGVAIRPTTATNASPVIMSNGGADNAAVNLAENATAVTTVTAGDTDLPAQTLSYSIAGGDDAARFSINPTTGALSLIVAPDFEVPTDADADNVYEVSVQVSDGSGGADLQSIAVTVSAVNDNAPAITSNGGGAGAAISVAENMSAVTTVTATDADLPAQTLTYMIVGGADAGRFMIDAATGVLGFVVAPDLEAPQDAGGNNVYDVIVGVSDGLLTDTQAIAVTVTNVNDAPTLGNGTLAAVDEDAANPPGQTIGAIFAGQFADVDAGSSFGGIAVVGNGANALTEGSWQYSSNGGADWFAIGTVGDGATALALSSSTLIRFVPAADINGMPPALVVRGLDNTYLAGFSSTAGSESRVTIDTASNGGVTAIAAVTATLSTTVTAVNDAPVITTSGGALAYTENQPATAIDPGLTISDADSTQMTGATVQIIAGYAAGQDRLNFSTQNGITGSWNPGTGVMTLSGTATLANYQTALRSVRFDNNSEAPSTAGRTISFNVTDAISGLTSLNAVRSVTVTAVNDAPSLGHATLAATVEDTVSPAGQSIATVFAGLFSDPDATASMAGIAVVGNTAAAAQGVWQYSSNGGGQWFDIGAVADGPSALAIDATSLLRFVSVADFNGPVTSLSVRALDNSYGGAFSNTTGSENRALVDTGTRGGSSAVSAAAALVSTSVTPVNDAPVITAAAGPIAYDENAAPILVASAFTVTDVDSSNLGGGVLQASFSGAATNHDRLTILPGGALSVLGNSIRHAGTAVASFSGGTGGMPLTITFNASSSPAIAEAIARQIVFFDSSDRPLAGVRTLDIELSDGDGGTSNTIQATISVTGTADSPLAVNDRATLIFDGIDDHLNVGSNPSLEITGSSLTMEALVNPSAYNPVSGSIVLNREGEYELGLSPTGSLRWAMANSNPGWAWHDTGYIVPLNGWSHLAVSVDMGVVSTFVNGTLVDIYHGAGNIGDAHIALDDLRIGGRSNAPAGQFFGGQIDDVRIWSIARTQAQIQAAMDQVLAPQAGLIGYWQLNEGVGSITADSAGGPTATLVDGGAGTPGPQWTAYRTDQNTQISIDASSGILRNDIDGDGDLLSVSKVNGNIGAANVGSAFTLPSGARLTVGADGAFVYDPNGAFASLVAGSTAVETFSYEVSDGNGGTDTATVTITISGLNDAPTLADGSLTAVDEGSTAPSGTAINSIFVGKFADADSGSGFAGVAVVGNAANALTHGSWQYSTNAGGNWFAIGTVADDASAIAIDSATLIRFVPVADYSGAPPALLVRALDNTHAGGFSSTVGGELRVNVDTTINGGSTAIAAATANLSTSITAINDAPLRSAGTVTNLAVLEDAAATSLGLAGLGYAPGGGADEAAQTFTFTVTAVPAPALGNITLADGSTIVTVSTGYSLAQLQGMMFKPTANVSGGPTTFSWRVTDSGGTANGGVDTLNESLNISITSVNDAPSGTSKTVTSAEDAAYTFNAVDFGFSDASDNPANALLAVEITTLPATGTLSNNGLAITVGQSIALGDISAGLLRFMPLADANGSAYANFTFQLQDNGGNANGGNDLDPTPKTITIDITPINDAPTTAALTLAPIAEDSGGRLITQAELLPNASDVDGPSLAAAGLAITSGTGSLVDNGDGTWTYTPALNDDGSVVFSYSVTDGSLSAAGSAILDITSVNDAPTTGAVTLASISEGSGPRLITQAELLANAADVDGPSSTATGLTIISGAGSLINNGDGTWTYTPVPNDDSAVSFSYSVTDGSLSAMGSASLDITPVNDAPTTAAVTLTPIAEDSGARLITQAELLANASDIDGPSLTAAGLIINSGAGSLVNNGNGSWTYTPALNDDSSVNFSYSVTDGSLSVAGSASLDITPVNDAPTTAAVTLTPIAEDSGARLINQAELLANAADVDGPSLTAAGLMISSGAGSLVDNGDGSWTYTPALNDDTSVNFSYTVTDGSLSAAGSATLDITAVNDAPTTSAVTLAAIAEDSGARLITQAELLANAADIDGPGLIATGLTITSGSGSLFDNGDGTWTYTPALNDDSSVSFGYTVTDGSLSVAGSATLDITPVNDAPTTGAITLTPIAEDSGARLITQAELLANASDVDGPSLTAGGLVISTGSGSLLDNGNGTWTYTPELNDDTAVAFSYRVTDGSLSVVGSATLDITPVIDAPTTSPVTLAPIAEDSGAQLITQAELLANAADVDGPSLTVTGLVISSGAGSLVDNGDGTWTYTPALNDDSSVSFSYTVSDGSLSVVGSATLDITPVNDAPTIATVTLADIAEDSGARLITQAELLANSSDVDGPSLTAVGLTISSGAGSLIDNGDGTWIYTPALNDDSSVAFSYTVTDGSLSVLANATLDITPVNDAPTTSAVTLAAIAEDSGARLITQSELLSNAADVDGPSLTAVGLTISSGAGSLIDNGDGTWTYTPALNDDTSVTFSYTVTDGSLSVAGSATLDITPVNDAPTTSPVTLTAIAEDSGPRLITQAALLANASDVDGPSLAATGLVISSGTGSLVDNGNGSWTYTPALNDDSSVSFGYTVSDGSLSAVGSATLDITPVNDAPTTAAVTLAAITEDSGARLITQAELLANASDVDGPSLTAVGLTISSGAGSLIDNGDGSWTYTPALNDDSSVSFSYTVTDGSLSAVGSATLDITPINDAPTTAPVALAAIAEDSGARLITQAELLAIAADVDGPSLSATGLTISSGDGSLVDNGDGTWTYTPALDDDTAVTFTYTVTDGSLSAAGSATLDITPLNDAPTTSAITLAAIAEDSGPRLVTQAELLANAANVDGPSLTAVGLTISSGSGSLFDNGDGTWTYTPGLNDDSSVSFGYTVTAGSLSAAGSATLDITAVNDAPTTSSVTLLPIAEDAGVRLITQAELLANAFDVDGPRLSAAGLTISSGSGSLIDNGDGSWTYTPALNDDTSVTFGYTVTDGSLSVAGSATLDITPVNDAPTTSPVTLASIAEDRGPRLITQAELLANAADVDGPALIATGLTIDGGSGSLVDNGDGSWTFTPTPNDDSAVSFSYIVTDGSLGVAGSATLDITSINDAPTTSAVTLAPIFEDSGARLITQAELLANASDVDGPSLTASNLVISSGAGSLVDNSNGSWTFTPALNDDSAATFSYTVTDGSLSVVGSATLDITAVNDSPTTSPVTLAAIAEDSGPRLITQAELLANASDVDGPSLAATGLVISSGTGSLVDNGDGTWTYTPGLNDDSSASFSYTVTDGSLSTAGSATLDITPVNDAPTSNPVTLTAISEDSGPRLITQAELLANAADVDGPSLSATGLAISSAAGSLVDNGDGSWTFRPALNDDSSVSFSYTVTDGSLSVAGSATMDITPVNDPPTTAVVLLASIAEDSVPRDITQAELLAAAADVDGPGLTATGLAISAGSGSLVDNGNGTWTYSPALDDDSSVTFSYTVTDGSLAVPGRASLDIIPVDDAPQVTLVPLNLSGVGTVRIDSTVLRGTDVDSPASSLVFSVLDVSNGHFEALGAAGVSISQFSQADVSAGRIVFVSTSAVDAPSFSLAPFDGNAYGATISASIDFRRSALSTSVGAAQELPGGSDGRMNALIEPPSSLTDGMVSAQFGFDRETDSVVIDAAPTAGRNLQALPAPQGIYILEPAQKGIERSASSLHSQRAAQAERTRSSSADNPDLYARVAADDYVASLDGFMLVDMLQVSGPGSRGNGDDFGPAPAGAIEESDGGLTLSDAARASAVALTAGTVWWALRAGSLLTGLLVSLPAWRHADLLAVLPDEEDDDAWDQPEDNESARDERAIDLVFESSDGERR